MDALLVAILATLQSQTTGLHVLVDRTVSFEWLHRSKPPRDLYKACMDFFATFGFLFTDSRQGEQRSFVVVVHLHHQLPCVH